MSVSAFLLVWHFAFNAVGARFELVEARLECLACSLRSGRLTPL